MSELLLVEDSLIEPVRDFYSLLYFVAAALVSLGVEALRRYIRHRLAIWESEHPVKKPSDSKDSSENGAEGDDENEAKEE